MPTPSFSWKRILGEIVIAVVLGLVVVLLWYQVAIIAPRTAREAAAAQAAATEAALRAKDCAGGPYATAALQAFCTTQP
jgi:hypothetical protein